MRAFSFPLCVFVVKSSWFLTHCFLLSSSTVSGVSGRLSLVGGAGGGGGFDTATLPPWDTTGATLSSLLSASLFMALVQDFHLL